MANILNENARELQLELDWLTEVLDARLKSYFGADEPYIEPGDVVPPDLSDSLYAQFLREHEVTRAERLVIILSLIPHVRPQLLDVLWAKNEATERGFTEFGGTHSSAHGFIPTGETAAFIIAGDDLAARFQLSRLFAGDHWFAQKNVLQLTPAQTAEPFLSGALALSGELISRFTTGAERKPAFNTEFPARLIVTRLSWDHLVLPSTTLEQLEEIKHWLQHGRTLLDDWGMSQKLRPGFTSLFYGPPGTGKTLSACLLGKHCGCNVYKIDLSMIVSKYIGETEKNLGRIFDMAEHRNWILFFDEADALFGKRTHVESSHDRFANQEVSFLLQRIEEFNGVVILASNIKTNIDDAFIRRFHSVVYFPMPKSAERRKIWQAAFSAKAELENRIDLGRLAEKHELSGGTIMNVVRYSSLKALSRNESTIWLEDMEEGIRREFLKEGKSG